MRGSGVVQGLKSLLHPQLPLSPKESQRLLTALTSSFRQKLDEAHPRQVHDEDARPTAAKGRTLKTGQHALHSSSVAFADQHLASVLTNPLLSRDVKPEEPALNLETATREIEENPGKDPISILEEYHQRDAATIPIAILCLRSFRDSLSKLSAEDRHEKVRKSQAGIRVLHWLWSTKLYESDEFVDDRRLMTPLVHVIAEEGEEHFLWSWLEFDLRLGSQDESTDRRDGKLIYHRYRWKGFVLRTLVSIEAEKSLNAGLDAYFRALDLNAKLGGPSRGGIVPIGSMVIVLNNRINASQWKGRAREPWDVERYDRYIQSIDHHLFGAGLINFVKGLLYLHHPEQPSPLPLLKILKAALDSDSPTDPSVLRKYFDVPSSKPRRRAARYGVLLTEVRELQRLGHIQDADWLIQHIRQIYPELEIHLERTLATMHSKKPPHVRREGESRKIHLRPSFLSEPSTSIA